MSISIFVAALSIGAAVFAQESKITFPIVELGGCQSKEECKTYCDVDANREACFSFAEKNGLMSKDETAIARKIGNQTGPGGCKGEECRTYCSDAAHTNECLAFAAKYGLVGKDDLDRAKKLAGKPGPGGCIGEAC